MQTAPGRTDRPDRPRFRQDLVAELVEDHGARLIDVMDLDSGSMYRFYEVEYSLACGMDGERDVPGLVKWAQEELGLTPSHQEVRTIIATLGDLGFIDTGDASAAAGTTPEPVARDSADMIENFDSEQTRAQAPSPALISAMASAAASNQLDLAPRVVTTPAARPAPSVDVELGAPGGAASSRDVFRPRTPDIALGAPGTARRADSAPAPASENIALGAPGGRVATRTPVTTPAVPPPSAGVSFDLADDFAVRPDDVKEAVRASRVMAAVEAPKDFVADKPAPRAPSRPPEPMRPPDVARAPEVSRPPEPVRPSDARTARPPVELPRSVAPAVASAADAAEAPRRGVSPVLIVVLVAAVLAAAAFAVWKLVLDAPAPAVEGTAAPVPPPVQPSPPPVPPPAPPAPTSKVVMEVPPPDDVKVGRAGVIENILADKTQVKEGDIVVRLVGDRPLQAELTSLGREQKTLQEAIDASTKKRDAAQAAGKKAAETAATNDIAAKQGQLAAKQGQLAAKTAELDKFLVHATDDGAFSPLQKAGQKVTADAIVAKIQRAAMPVATFKVADARRYAATPSFEVSIGSAEHHASCTASDIQADSIKVACPADAALVDGADVTLKLPEGVPPAAVAPATSATTTPPRAAPAATPPSPAPASGAADPTPTVPSLSPPGTEPAPSAPPAEVPPPVTGKVTP